jgi:hypothetical protein
MNVLDHFHHLDSGMKAALISGVIGSVTTLMAALFGFGAIIFQMREQGRQSRQAIAENERRKLKASMYEDALLVSRAMSDFAIELSTKLRMMEVQLRAVDRAIKEGNRYLLPSTRLPLLSSIYSQFADAAIKVVFLIENRRIIEPRLLIFRIAISAVLHDITRLMFSDLHVLLLPALPIDGPGGDVLPYTPPHLAEISAIQILNERLLDSLGDAIAYSEDLLVELQNLLLGDLFERSLPPRCPLNPAKKVITLEKSGELEKWFRSSTEWGKAQTETEDLVRFKYSNGD